MSERGREQRLVAAFDAAAGRRRSEAPVRLRRLARRVLDARARQLAEEPCPRAVVARACGLFRQRARTPVARLLRLLFDSAAAPQPARRGARSGRVLRLAGHGIALDVRLTRVRAGLRLEVAVDGQEAALVRLLVGQPRRAERLTLDTDGVASAHLRSGTRDVRLELLLRSGSVLRTPVLSLAP